MTFRVTNQTQVRIDGRQASAGDIQQGGDARVAYQIAGNEPTATLVQVVTGHPSQAPQPPSRSEPPATAQPPSSPEPAAPSQGAQGGPVGER
jgi:hypothetical protein